MDLGALMSKLGQTWPARIAKDAVKAASFPGRVYASETPVSTEEMVGPAADITMNLAGGGTAFAEKNAAGIFGGRLAKTANLDAEETARQMLAKGTPNESVHAYTGWSQGKDGLLRFEIPGNKSRLDTDAVHDAVSNGREVTLSSFFDDPALYKAYPPLANMKVIPDLTGSNSLGAYHPVKNTMHIGPATANLANDPRGTILHELNHAVQSIEGFGAGSSVGAEKVLFAKEAKARLDSALTKEGRDSMAREINKIFENWDKGEGWNRYAKVAGEVESRNTELRKNMSPGALLRNPPEITEMRLATPFTRENQTHRTWKDIGF